MAFDKSEGHPGRSLITVWYYSPVVTCVDAPGGKSHSKRVSHPPRKMINSTIGMLSLNHKRWLLVPAAIVTFCTIPVSVVACSVGGCIGRGAELRKNFIVTVTHQDKPLRGVSVQIARTSDVAGHQSFLELTGADGGAHFANLPPGDYWMEAKLLGITAGYECFHINSSASRNAEKSRRYSWGDEAPAVRQAAGRLVDSRPGKGGNPLENLFQRVNVPIPEARLELRRPVIGTVYATVSDASGHFTFDRVPVGTYVLHINAGTAPGDRAFDAADLLVRFSEAAKLGTLLLTRSEPVGGSCGGTSLQIE